MHKLSNKNLLTQEQVQSFQENGYLVLKNFYDSHLIHTLCEEIRSICLLLSTHHNIPVDGSFQKIYRTLIQNNPSLHGVIYDALKNLPSFLRLVSLQRNVDLAAHLFGCCSSHIGIGARSYGIRIDQPMDDIYMTDWHQDFHFHARSKKGLVFWTSLTDITQSMGPLQVLPGTHKAGPKMLIDYRNDHLKSGDYTKIANAVKIEHIQDIIENGNVVDVHTASGDLLVFDYHLLHKSSFNQSDKCRWTVQIRLFDFNDPWGIERAWSGSVTSGVDYSKIIPEFLKK
jgi:ectoine hydroxylase-related dioxygenase (phytanoyl-CoA dioxygenase family)